MKLFATIQGTVVKGTLMGRTLGFPTINIAFDRCDIPFGVYASRVYALDKWYEGALHFGPRKVLGIEEPSLEIHLLDFSGDLYNHAVTIEIYDKIRPTLDFEALDNLKRQIRLDIEAIRALFVQQGLQKSSPVPSS